MRWFFVYNDILDYKMTKKNMGLQPCPTLLLPTIFEPFGCQVKNLDMR